MKYLLFLGFGSLLLLVAVLLLLRGALLLLVLLIVLLLLALFGGGVLRSVVLLRDGGLYINHLQIMHDTRITSWGTGVDAALNGTTHLHLAFLRGIVRQAWR